jgi:hypothetical protein
MAAQLHLLLPILLLILVHPAAGGGGGRGGPPQPPGPPGGAPVGAVDLFLPGAPMLVAGVPRLAMGRRAISAPLSIFCMENH